MFFFFLSRYTNRTFSFTSITNQSAADIVLPPSDLTLQRVSQGLLSHPELLVAVEMLSSVVLMNQAMDVGDRAALWRQLSSAVTGLSNVEDEYAQR